MKKLFLLIVYRDLEQKNVIYLGLYEKLKDIIEKSNNFLRYSDYGKNKKYKTSKSFFKIVEVKNKRYFRK